ncbi:MAG: CatA-like O-acetyltransferase [Desulfobacterales bacterium]
MEEIIIETWKRKEYYLFFKNIGYPNYNVCFDIDITRLYSFIKDRKMPIYYSLVYYFMYCANQIEAFKYRRINEKVFKFETVHPSFTVMDTDSELFKIVTVLFDKSPFKFIEEAIKKSKDQKGIIDATIENREDIIHITSIPWINFTSISHPISLEKFDSIPRISWGKFVTKDKKINLPFSVQVNHAFVDGIHIGKYYEHIEKNFSRLESIFG